MIMIIIIPVFYQKCIHFSVGIFWWKSYEFIFVDLLYHSFYFILIFEVCFYFIFVGIWFNLTLSRTRNHLMAQQGMSLS